MRRGILGGTFDPPHMAHLFAGEAAYRDLGLDVVTFIPAGAPWQKAGRIVSEPHHRVAMTRLATEPAGYFEVDEREVARNGWTFTVDTLASYPVDETLLLVVGADTAGKLRTWHRADDVIARAEIAVVPRPGIDRTAVEEELRGTDHVWLDTPEIDLSGTMLRRHAGEGRSLRFLVPDPVWRYVEEHGLYRRSGTTGVPAEPVNP